MTEPQFKEINFAVPWGQIAAKTYGVSTGEPVLMVHGRLDNAGSFTRLMKYLPMNIFYYVCIDLPGHGWSSQFPSWLILDYMTYVQALSFILEALKWKECIYIGHSFGGQIGLIFSSLYSYKIKKLILLDAFLFKDPKVNFISYLKNASIFSFQNIKPILYTKEEVLHALKTKRIFSLCSEAADALFERTVTEVNGKYKYNRDIRLKNISFIYINDDQYFQIISQLTIPTYLFVASDGLLSIVKPTVKKQLKLLLNEINPKTKFQIIYISGNHDVHNNNPEIIGPFIHKILTNDYSSKL